MLAIEYFHRHQALRGIGLEGLLADLYSLPFTGEEVGQFVDAVTYIASWYRERNEQQQKPQNPHRR